MTTYLKLFFIGFILLSITSCGTTNNVSSNRLIQKRKYTRGVHFRSHSIVKNEHKEKSNLDADLTDSQTNTDDIDSRSTAGVLSTKEKSTSILFASELNTTKNNHSIKSIIKVLVEKSKIQKENRIIETELKPETEGKDDKNEQGDSYDPLAIIGFILSIIALLAIVFFIYSLTVLSLSVDVYIANVFIILIALALSISFSSVALKHTKNNKRKGRKLAIAGLTIAASIAAISLSYLLIGFIFNYII